MGKDRRSSGTPISARPYVILFGLTAAAFFLAAFVPQWRVWGLGTWTCFPIGIRLALLGVAAGMAVGAYFLKPVTEHTGGSGRHYIALAAVIGGTLVALMILLRQQTHFLGDGYTTLGWLEDIRQVNKGRNFGAQISLLTLAKLLPTDALGVYRTIAWGAGILAVAGTFAAAARLFDDSVRRVLFALGVLSGGYMLLFFGYVENYAIFVLMVILFCLLGSLAALGRIPRWWVVLPMAAASFYHIFGVTLLPAAAYLLLQDTGIGKRLDRLSTGTRWLLVALVAIAGLLLFAWFYSTSYFFRFSFVPIVSNRFTVDGYTLLSLPHLADLVNLLVLLSPGILLVVLAIRHRGAKFLLERPVYRFLGLTALGSWGAAFIFDPKLGMPRDWDLFSLTGVPLVIGGMLAVLELTPRRIHSFAPAILVIGLGILSLWPRVVVQHVPAQGIAQFDIYRALDPIKNRNGGYYLIEYTRRTKGDAEADRMAIEWNRTLQDQQYLNMANQVMQEGRFREALTLFQAALRENPVYWVAYTNIAEAYLNLGKSDSALEMLRIADGLNPKSPIIMSNLGQLYHYRGESERALAIWRESAELDPAFVQPRIFLAKHYRTIRDRDNWLAMSEEIAALPDAPADNLAALADYYVSTRRFADAAPLYGRALAGGLDTTRVRDIAEEYPELREELNRWMSTATAE